MTVTEPQTAVGTTTYDLEGTLLEACSCGVLCPCWVGEDPDGGSCDAFLAYNLTHGTIQDVDVSGLTLAAVVRIPGNVLAGDWKQVVLVDDRASDEQMQALLAAFGGQLGGPLADLAQLVGEVLEVRRVPIRYGIENGAGTIEVDGTLHAEMAPFTGPDGSKTTLQESIFSTVPGSPAYVAKASAHTVNLPEHGMVWSFEGRNAIESDWHMIHTEPA